MLLAVRSGHLPSLSSNLEAIQGDSLETVESLSLATNMWKV